MSEESKYLEKLEVEPMELDGETEEKLKVKYMFKLLANTHIDNVNLNLDLKDAKAGIKEAGFEPARLTEAIKYNAKDGVNVKMDQAVIVEEYMVELKNGGDRFEGAEKPLISTINNLEEVKDGQKNLKDKSGEVGIDYKALNQLAKEYVDNINPNKKPKKEDIVLDGVIEEYATIVKE